MTVQRLLKVELGIRVVVKQMQEKFDSVRLGSVFRVADFCISWFLILSAPLIP